MFGNKEAAKLLTLSYAKFIQEYPGGDKDISHEIKQLHRSIALELSEVGDLYLRLGRPEKAVAEYEEALTHYANGDIYYQYANSLFESTRLNSSLLAYKIAGALGYRLDGYTYFRMACIYSRLGNKQLGFEYLDLAIMNGFANETLLQQDRHLEFLRSQPGWAEWLASKKALWIKVKDYLRNCLVAEYPFEGNANDQSGNGHHGLVHGATLAPNRLGNSKSCYYFDGQNDFIEIGQLPTIEKSNELTICYWFLLTDHDGFDVCGYISGYREKALRLGLDPERHIFINPGTHTDIHSSNMTFELQRWYHYAMSIKGGESAHVFVNGKPVFQTSNGVPDTLQDPPCFSIGAGNEMLIGRSRAHYFEGMIDDVQIYNRSLSEDDIGRLYNQTASK
jgi:tetratricopeptide (TPR) repeat protein